jgi:hypothetical protein
MNAVRLHLMLCSVTFMGNVTHGNCPLPLEEDQVDLRSFGTDSSRVWAAASGSGEFLVLGQPKYAKKMWSRN